MPAQRALRWRMRWEKWKSKYSWSWGLSLWCPMQYVQLWFWLQTSRRCTAPSTRGRETVDSEGSAGAQCGRRFTAASTRDRETVDSEGSAGAQCGRRFTAASTRDRETVDSQGSAGAQCGRGDTVLACEGKYRASYVTHVEMGECRGHRRRGTCECDMMKEIVTWSNLIACINITPGSFQRWQSFHCFPLSPQNILSVPGFRCKETPLCQTGPS
jgi:hypothetical protein